MNAAHGLRCATPAAAFYAMISATAARGDAAHDAAHSTTDSTAADERFVLDLLAATGVLVVHGSGFGADPRAGSFRLVYLADTDLLGTALDRIADFNAERAGGADSLPTRALVTS